MIAVGYAAVLVIVDEKRRIVMGRKTCNSRYPWGCDAAFPGGRVAPGETVVETALREAQEEVCLEPTRVAIVGVLEPVSPRNVNDLQVYPVLAKAVRPLQLKICSEELDRLAYLPIEELCRWKLVMWRHPLRGIRVEALKVDDEVYVWGMSLRVLERIKEWLCKRVREGTF
ncbi:MAG: NUDIX domain-containing protein [Desulfurococcales archaeon]|nr:NUDIX domain-containing protein [Desulfurococcales archaeon]